MTATLTLAGVETTDTRECRHVIASPYTPRRRSDPGSDRHGGVPHGPGVGRRRPRRPHPAVRRPPLHDLPGGPRPARPGEARRPAPGALPGRDVVHRRHARAGAGRRARPGTPHGTRRPGARRLRPPVPRLRAVLRRRRAEHRRLRSLDRGVRRRDRQPPGRGDPRARRPRAHPELRQRAGRQPELHGRRPRGHTRGAVRPAQPRRRRPRRAPPHRRLPRRDPQQLAERERVGLPAAQGRRAARRRVLPQRVQLRVHDEPGVLRHLDLPVHRDRRHLPGLERRAGRRGLPRLREPVLERRARGHRDRRPAGPVDRRRAQLLRRVERGRHRPRAQRLRHQRAVLRRGHDALRDRHQPQRPGTVGLGGRRVPRRRHRAELVQPAGPGPGPAADDRHGRPAGRRLPVDQGPRRVRRPVHPRRFGRGRGPGARHGGPRGRPVVPRSRPASSSRWPSPACGPGTGRTADDRPWRPAHEARRHGPGSPGSVVRTRPRVWAWQRRESSPSSSPVARAND